MKISTVSRQKKIKAASSSESESLTTSRSGLEKASSSLHQLSKILQLVSEEEINKSITNIRNYSPDLLVHYGEERVRAVLRVNDMTVRGHHSGGKGDGQNAATTQDLAALRLALQAYQPPVEDEEDEHKVVSKAPSDKKHSEEKQVEVAKQKEDKKKDKKAAKKEKYEQSVRANFGKRPPKGGGSGGGIMA